MTGQAVWRDRFRTPVLLALCTLASGAAQAIDLGPEGVLPTNEHGRPLNLDFETGTLEDWTASGEAFSGQPIEGDTVAARGGDMKSWHQGKYWIGGFERKGDAPQGTLQSAPFKVTHTFASFRVGGGATHATRVELVRRDTGEVIFTRSGDNTESLKAVVVDLFSVAGKEIFIRLVDEGSTGWGHLNFDDFKFHERRPKFPAEIAPPPPPDDYPFAGLAPAEAAREMRVPEGFTVQLFAGEPDVKQPIAMALDERGRLWVAEAYTYPIRAKDGHGRDRILIFEDTDGDGRFDKRTVFIERLNLVSGLEVGYGGVWVGAAPYLLFIPDRNHDDVPDGEPEILLDGWAYQDTHETLNTFIWGPDGWLYGCHGVFTHSRVGKPGTPHEQRVPINAGIWRYHPTRHEFEVFAQGTSNPWGVDFNDYGQAFCTACVIPHMYHVIQGARYERQAGDHFNPFTYNDIKTIADHRHWLGDTPHGGNSRSDAAGGGHAHAGAMIYLGGSWPAEYRNQIFMNNIHGQRINMDRLTREGSGYVCSHGPDFCLARDSWSQILNLRYGPDGQAYMIDWYDANACHHNRPDGHDRSNGRIFKIVYRPNYQPVQVDLRKLSDAELVNLQLSDNDWYVRHGRKVLAERGPQPAVHEALAKIAFEHPDETRRLRGLWALHVTGGLSEQELLRGLGDTSEYVRGWCIQLASENVERPLSAAVLARFARLAERDRSPLVRLYLASAAQRHPSAGMASVVGHLAAHGEDAADHNLPLMLWYALERQLGERPDAALDVAERGRIPLLLTYAVRRVASEGTPEALAKAVERLGHAEDPAVQQALLEAINLAQKGRRKVEMPANWSGVYAKLVRSDSPAVRRDALTLALVFGDPQALVQLRAVVDDSQADAESRRAALDALLRSKDPELAPTLHKLVSEPALRSAALRGLALYDHADTAGVLLAAYSRFNLAEKRDALNTLAARAGSAVAMLQAIGRQQIPAADLSADIVRQLRNHKSEEIDRLINEFWGTARDTAADKAELIAHYTKLLTSPPTQPPDVAQGRALFVKTCQQCHTLFGVGGKVGPELTGSNRANLEYLLSNVIDPSAVIAREYQPSVIVTTDGRVITGIVKKEEQNALTVQTANELLTVPRDEIDTRDLSPQSMMPEDQLKPMSDDDVRALVAYLASPSQTPVLATEDTIKGFFSGTDLAGWQGDAGLWSVENGEIVGRALGLDHNEFLKSDLILANFRLKLRVKLLDNQGNSGVQFRSAVLPNGDVAGYQADIGAGWWGKLYEEHGRELLWKESGEAYLRPGDWNDYEILAVGSRIRTYLNGHLCVDLDDPAGAPRGIIAFQLHAGGATEVRFRDFELELNPTLDAVRP